jgi:putative ABC transport system substrate-binding protein
MTMRPRRAIGAALIVLIVASATAVRAAGPIRIGVLTESWGLPPGAAGLREGLKALGYRENEDFVLGVRFTQGDHGALTAGAQDLLRAGVQLIFVEEPGPARAAKNATTRLPIVLGGAGDPLGLGLIQSFSQPGGNVTGVTDLDAELGPKRLEVLRELVPTLRRVLFAYSAADAYSAAEARAYHGAAQRLGVTFVEKPLRTQEEARSLFATLGKGDVVDGILAPGVATLNIPGFIVDAKLGIPTMFGAPFWVERGGLASYGPDFEETGRQAARIVQKIVKGAAPGTIPVEVNRKITFVINTKVARSLGLTIPAAPLHRIDRFVD